MKCISIRQPWADLIITGKKKLEIRSWPIAHRGRLLIHAGLKTEYKECQRLSVEPSCVGVILGVVKLVDVRILSEKDWEELRSLHLEKGERCYGDKTFGWFFEEAEKFSHPIKFKGALGIFNVPDKILERRK